MTGGCSYEHDVSDERFDDIDGDRWACPHPADGDRCVFHGDASDDERRERLLAAVADGDPATNRLLGATVDALDLDYREIDGPTSHPVDLREATVGSLSWRFGRSDHPVDLRGATVDGRFDLEDTTFKRRVDLGDVRFGGRVSLRLATFESWLDTRRATFEAPVYARVARFHKGVYGVNMTFEDAADFTNAQFDDVANCYGTRFAAGARFKSATFVGSARFEDCVFEGPVVELGSVTGNPKRDPSGAGDAALELTGARCDKHLKLDGATFDGDLRLRDLSLERDLQCTEVTVETEAATVDLTETERVTGRASAAGDRLTYDLTDATVGEIDLRDATDFDAFEFQDTRFDGFDFGDYKRLLAAVEYRLHDPGDPPDVREGTYLRAKNGAKQTGENRAVAEFFLREMRARRAGHALAAREASGVARLRHAGRYLGNLGLSVTCGYGERPSRTVGVSFAVILLFALAYAVAGVGLTIRESAVGYLTFSVQSFVALVLGGPEAGDTLVSFLGALEGFIGGFMIALFVFALTRSVSR